MQPSLLLSDALPHLFRIGIRPLGDEARFAVDQQLPLYLAEKGRLATEHFAGIFAAEAGTELAQREVLGLVLDEILKRYPDIYRQTGDAIDIRPAERRVRLDGNLPPLWIAAQMVQEDLVLMRKDRSGWRLVAAALCFPSSWRLAEKFGKPMHDVHGPVPGFGTGTRNATMIERMFDNLRIETPVVRGNWSLYGDDQLFHPASAEPDTPRFGNGPRAANVFLRVERQTLSKLPESGDILFTIRIFVDPLTEIEKSPEAKDIARQIKAGIEMLDAEQLAYKGLSVEKDRILERLSETAGRMA